MSDTDNAILMAFCSNCVVEHSTVTDSGGIWALKSDNNTFRFNNFSNSYIHGITLDYHSSNNIIHNNIISHNDNAGVMLEYHSKGNIIRNNNILNNPFNAYFIQSFGNTWDNNYWDDWIWLDHPFFAAFFPKVIQGTLSYKVWVPFFNVDRNPADEPFEIVV